jgi:hypothetical protein
VGFEKRRQGWRLAGHGGGHGRIGLNTLIRR